MGVRKLRKLGSGDYGVTLPKQELEELGLIDENGDRINDEQRVFVQSQGELDEGEWRIKVCETRE